MTEQEKIDRAIDAVLLNIESAPVTVRQIVFQVLQADLRFYRVACHCEAVAARATELQIYLTVLNVEQDTIYPCLDPLENVFDPASESLN